MAFSVSPNFPFQNKPVGEMMESHSELYFLQLHVRRNVNCNGCWIFLSSSDFAVCLSQHLSPNLHLAGVVIFAHSRN